MGGTNLRIYAGLTDYPWGTDPATLNYRFYNRNNDTVQVIGGIPNTVFSYEPGDSYEIERIGSRLLFRKNSSLIHLSTHENSAPLYLDNTFFDMSGRVHQSRVSGYWTDPANWGDLDQDDVPDDLEGTTVFDERWVIDGDPEDAIQSVYDVLPGLATDTDGDGLTDREEFAVSPRKTNPAKADSDEDGLDDRVELEVHLTDPWEPDSDFDGLSDLTEVTDVYGFDATDPDGDSDNDGVGDLTEWRILVSLQNLARPVPYSTQEQIEGGDDFDGDGVSNLHESEDGTYADDIEDYFLPVEFGRLFGDAEGAHWTLETHEGINSSRLVRLATAAPGAAAGGVSHHEAKDGTRVRFQFLPLASNVSGTQVAVGFSHRGLNSDEAGDIANYAVAIRRTTDHEAEILLHGTRAAGTLPFAVSSDDLLEMRLELGAAPRIHLQKLDAAMNPTANWSVDLPSGFDSLNLDRNPLALVVALKSEGSGIHNLRHRLFHDPDRDNDGMADRWEILYGLDPANPTDAEAHGDADGLTNLEEFQQRDETSGGAWTGAGNPLLVSTAGDGFSDGWKARWEIALNLVLATEGGSHEVDPDQDGLTHAEEQALGTHPFDPDSDDDEMGDGWEVTYGPQYDPPGDPVAAIGVGNGLDPLDPSDGIENPDDDGLSNVAEFAAGTNPHGPDTDGDTLNDGVEVDLGLDPRDPADAGYDWDYDGIGIAEELTLGTDFQPRWRVVPIPSNGFAGWTGPVADPALADPLIGSFNHLGQLARVENIGGELWVRRFDPLTVDPENDGWSRELDSLGRLASAPVSHLQEIRQNDRGLVAVSFLQTQPSPRLAHLRILDRNRRPHLLGQDLGWKSVTDLHVTDSGFVVAVVETHTPLNGTHRFLLRWRDGEWDLAPLAAGPTPDLLGVSERGETLANGRGLLAHGSTQWDTVYSQNVGIHPYGSTPSALPLDFVGYLHQFGGITAPRHALSPRGDSALWLSMPLSADGFQVTPLTPGHNTVWVWSPTRTARHLAGAHWQPAPAGESVDPNDSSTNYSWVNFGFAMNRAGDLAGGYIADLETLPYHNGADSQHPPVPLAGYGTAYLAQRGRTDFSLEAPTSRFWAIGDRGHVLASTVAFTPVWIDNLQTGYTTETTWSVYVPDNDGDRNGLPDDWEQKHFGAVGTVPAYRDDDRDGLETRGEFLYGTDPNQTASHDDNIPDGWKVEHGVNPAKTAPETGGDPDHDNLHWQDEFNQGWDPYDPDTDNDQLPDDEDPENDESGEDFDETGLRFHFEHRNDPIHKNGWHIIHDGKKRVYQNRTQTMTTFGSAFRTFEMDDVETTRNVSWVGESVTESSYPVDLSPASRGPVEVVHTQSATLNEVSNENVDSESAVISTTDTFEGGFESRPGESPYPYIQDRVTVTGSVVNKDDDSSEPIDYEYEDSRDACGSHLGGIEWMPGIVTETESSYKEEFTFLFVDDLEWDSEGEHTLTSSYTARISDAKLLNQAYRHAAAGATVWDRLNASEIPEHSLIIPTAPSDAWVARFVGVERYSDTSDADRAYVHDGSFQWEVESPDGRLISWWEGYRIMNDLNQEVAAGILPRYWKATTHRSPIYRMGDRQQHPDLPEGNVQVHHFGGMTSSRLVVEVVATERGKTNPPEDGLLVKVGDQFDLRLSENPQNQFPFARENIVWQIRQMQRDGTLHGWEGTALRGVKVSVTAVHAGIFQFRAKLLTGTGEMFVDHLRKRDEVAAAFGNYRYGNGKAGVPDYIGFAESQKQVDLVRTAQAQFGTLAYEVPVVVPASRGFPEVAAGDFKCNIFVAHMGVDAGIPVPMVGGRLHMNYPPSANQWVGEEDTSLWPGDQFDIEGWTLPDGAAKPQPGVVIAWPGGSGSGHVGILDYDGGGISAEAGSGRVGKMAPFLDDPAAKMRKPVP